VILNDYYARAACCSISAMAKRTGARKNDEELVEVRRAAALVGRHPETIRRWIWSGRLEARRRANRLVVDRAEVESLAGQQRRTISLREWADHARAARATDPDAGTRGSAADLVIEDRQQRSARPRASAGR
jgi:hypothetical protein